MKRLTSTSPFLASIFTFVSAFSLGCVITLGNGDDSGANGCGGLLDNNDENCVCDPGHERCNPDDPSDTDCCEKEGHSADECPDPNSSLEGGECFCSSGYTWCSDDPADLTCCVDPGQTSQGTGSGSATEGGSTTEEQPTTSQGTTGGPAECLDAVDPPPTCDANTELAFCSNPESCGPEGSSYYSCEGGVWVEDPGALTELCTFDGFDFAYGCVDSPNGVLIDCGTGSGTACSGTAGSCLDANTLSACQYGKSSEYDCFKQCTEVGEGGVFFDFGDCQVQGDVAACACCNEDDPGCEMGGGTSTSGGTSTGGDTSSSG